MVIQGMWAWEIYCHFHNPIVPENVIRSLKIDIIKYMFYLYEIYPLKMHRYVLMWKFLVMVSIQHETKEFFYDFPNLIYSIL